MEYRPAATTPSGADRAVEAMSSPEFAQIVETIRAFQRSRALTVAAELGIADLLRDGPRTAPELADATGTHAPVLYRLLRALASIGVFQEDGEQRFALTATGQYLRTDHPLSVDPLARFFGADYEWRAWGDLIHSVRTGENAAVHALGVDVWEHRRRHPEDGAAFDAAMRTLSRAQLGPLLAAHDFGRYTQIVDVGGGTGALLADVLQQHPGVRGTLFDQPHVVADAAPILQAADVADRVTIVAGDFFAEVPTGADAYLLRRILHDWDDADCLRILHTLRRAVTPRSRLLIVDAVVGPPNEDPTSKFLDLMMLVSAGGRERTEPQWRALLAEGGFHLERITPAALANHLIEAVPA
jgi:O-methyltransferase domain/Dimerisation domain